MSSSKKPYFFESSTVCSIVGRLRSWCQTGSCILAAAWGWISVYSPTISRTASGLAAA